MQEVSGGFLRATPEAALKKHGEILQTLDANADLLHRAAEADTATDGDKKSAQQADQKLLEAIDEAKKAAGLNKVYEKADKLHKVAEQTGSSNEAKMAAAQAEKELDGAEEKMEHALGLAKGWMLETQYKMQQAQEEANDEVEDDADEKMEDAEDEADEKAQDDDDQLDQQLMEQAPDGRNMYTSQDELEMKTALDKLEKRVKFLKEKAALPGADRQEKILAESAEKALRAASRQEQAKEARRSDAKRGQAGSSPIIKLSKEELKAASPEVQARAQMDAVLKDHQASAQQAQMAVLDAATKKSMKAQNKAAIKAATRSRQIEA